MEIVINTNTLSIHPLSSKSELKSYISGLKAQNILLGEDSETEDLFFMIKLTNIQKTESIFCIGLITTNYGIIPSILPIGEENKLIIGFNKEIVFFDLNTKKTTKSIPLSSFFHRLIYIPIKKAVLIACELGMYRMDTSGNIQWEITGDIVSEYSIYDNTISISFIDEANMIIEIDTGKISKPS